MIRVKIEVEALTDTNPVNRGQATKSVVYEATLMRKNFDK
jgi:hypothetical protein